MFGLRCQLFLSSLLSTSELKTCTGVPAPRIY